MGTRSCGCRDVSIIEGVFGEILPEIRRVKQEWGEGEYSETDSSLLSGSVEPTNLEPKIIKSYTMINTNRMEVVVITWGSSIVSLKCPDKYGHSLDVVLGFDDIKSYTNPDSNPYIGCILGRCANRIKDAFFSIKEKDYELPKNDHNGHHLHGGPHGFGRQIWDAYIDGCSVIMSYLSEDGEEGYPGSVLASVRYKLTPDNKLEISMRATTSKPTIVNMSHGTFFNLAGHNSGETELRKHKVSLNCDRWTFAEYADPVPTGAIRGVGGTIMDLRIPKVLNDCMDKIPPGEGYNHNFCVVQNWQPGASFVAKVLHAKTGRVLEVYSDQPGVQFYTSGNLIPPYAVKISCDDSGEGEESLDLMYEDFSNNNGRQTNGSRRNSKLIEYITGKKGAQYKNKCAFTVQPQNYPNAINYPHFPCSILYPGQVYHHDLIYKFGIQFANFM